MMGNGIANIVAAAIVAGAILWNGGSLGGGEKPADEDFTEWYARAVGDIRNDIVVNCGCCGEGEAGPRRAAKESF